MEKVRIVKNIPLKIIKPILLEYAQDILDLEVNFHLDDVIDKFAEYDLKNNSKQMEMFKSQLRVIYLYEGSNSNEIVYMTLQSLTKIKTREQTVRSSNFRKEIMNRDKCCRVTGMGGLLTRRCESAHIVDFALCDTEFEKYDPNNGIFLFDGIHKSWDAGYLIAIPDISSNTVKFSIREDINLSYDDICQNIPEITKIKVLTNVSSQMMHYFNIRYNIDIKRHYHRK